MRLEVELRYWDLKLFYIYSLWDNEFWWDIEIKIYFIFIVYEIVSCDEGFEDDDLVLLLSAFNE